MPPNRLRARTPGTRAMPFRNNDLSQSHTVPVRWTAGTREISGSHCAPAGTRCENNRERDKYRLLNSVPLFPLFPGILGLSEEVARVAR